MAVFDIEADDLYDKVTKIHCLSYTLDGTEYHTLYTYDGMRDFLNDQKVLIGHNIVRYDLRVLEKILEVDIKAKLYDTLPMAWYMDHDQLRHGLEVYGDKYKVPKPVITDWKNLTPAEYQHRCETDVKINWLLWQDLIKRMMFLYKDKQELDRFLQYLTFKMKCAAWQEEVGIKLDIDAVRGYVETLTQQQEEKVRELAKAMPRRKLFKKKSPPKNMFKKDGTPSAHGLAWFELMDSMGLDRTHDEEVSVPNGDEEANPNSSDQVKDWLFSLGWKPCTFDYKKNDDGSERAIPQVRDDGELAESVKLLIDDNPSVAILDGLTVIQHRLAIFQGFLDCAVEKEDGWYVKAEIAGLTNTLRMKHAKPMVNLPGVDKILGKEVRGSIIAPEGKLFCGSDMTSLEDTTRRHYVKPLDPDYVAKQSEPGYDPHLDLAVKAGMCSEDDYEFYKAYKDADNLTDEQKVRIKSLTSIRKKAKVVTYSATYGVGKVKLARSTGMSEEEAGKLLKAFWEINWAIKRVAETATIRKIGGKMWVYNPVSRFWINLRYERDAFSSLNQSTGVFCFDSWLAQLWRRGIRGAFQAHDEILFVTDNVDETNLLIQESIADVNAVLNLNVPLSVDAKYGRSYADVH